MEIKRLVYKSIEKGLKNIGMLLITGPKFCMIITNCDQTYQDKNGVYIVPHTLLRP